jgi:hypothetical protein
MNNPVTIVALVVAAALAAIVGMSAPEIRRYLKIRSM